MVLFLGLLIFWVLIAGGVEAKILSPAHQDIPCSTCHYLRGKPALKTKSPKLCLPCHPESNLHPTEVPLLPQMRGPVVSILPFDEGKRVVCITCHYIHPEDVIQKKPFLLRGESGDTEGPLSNLCLFCHFYDGLDTHNPHVKRRKCVYCHMAPPEKAAESRKIRNFLGRHACEPCHNAASTYPADFKRCVTEFNPFKDPEVAKMRKSLGIYRSRLICSDCHNVHGVFDPQGPPAQRFLLRLDYLAAASRSRSINPHWTGVFCLACHQKRPEKGKKYLLFPDINKVCQRCHDNKFAKADIHPVGVKPSPYVHIPPDFPLQDGKLTCETCHVASLQICYPGQKISREKSNINFLRVPNLKREEFCLLCHRIDYYRRLNPHKDQIVNGKINKKACLFCHSSVPDVQEMGSKRVRFVVDNPNKICLICHPGMDKGHPAGVNHLRRPSGKILQAIKTSVKRIGIELPLYNGKIICATCHNPHQPGVLKVPAASKGAGKPERLRLRTDKSICIACHVDKQ